MHFPWYQKPRVPCLPPHYCWLMREERWFLKNLLILYEPEKVWFPFKVILTPKTAVGYSCSWVETSLYILQIYYVNTHFTFAM